MSAPVLELRDVVSRIGRADVLQGVSLTVEVGQAVCLLGPNGAGKTTLLRTVSGLIDVRGGSLWFEGNDIGKIPPWDRVGLGIAHVPQDRRCFAGLSVTENLRMGAYLQPRSFEKRCAEVMEMFPALHEKRDADAGDLSGGQQQMLAIGRALMSGPRLLLLDEPTLGLAPAFVLGLKQLLSGIAERRDIAMLLVEQNVSLATIVCDHAYVIHAGRMVISARASSTLTERELTDAYLGAGV
jgi:branched-chain amino acid transport system ATP-binding protein